MAKLAYAILALGTFFTFAGFGITVGGLGSLQWKANDLRIAQAHEADPEGTAPLVAAYTATFTEAVWTPYPFNQGYQFGYAWWLVMGELAVWVLTLWLCVMPKHIPSAKLVVLTFLASFQMLAWHVINTLLFLSRNAVAQSAFGSARIDATLAGVMIVAIGNAVTIIALGLYGHHDQPEAAPPAQHKASKAEEVV